MRLLTLLIVACGGDKVVNYSDGASDSSHCVDDWQAEGEVFWEPGSCLGWSPQSEDEMTWYQAVSPAEALDGGCGSHCDETSPGYCEGLDGLGGHSGWRLPSLGELEQTAINDPPLSPLEGDLWSKDTEVSADENAWTVDFSQPGWSILLGKTQEAYVRCVIDANE